MTPHSPVHAISYNGWGRRNEYNALVLVFPYHCWLAFLSGLGSGTSAGSSIAWCCHKSGRPHRQNGGTGRCREGEIGAHNWNNTRRPTRGLSISKMVCAEPTTTSHDFPEPGNAATDYSELFIARREDPKLNSAPYARNTGVPPNGTSSRLLPLENCPYTCSTVETYFSVILLLLGSGSMRWESNPLKHPSSGRPYSEHVAGRFDHHPRFCRTAFPPGTAIGSTI